MCLLDIRIGHRFSHVWFCIVFQWHNVKYKLYRDTQQPSTVYICCNASKVYKLTDKVSQLNSKPSAQVGMGTDTYMHRAKIIYIS